MTPVLKIMRGTCYAVMAYDIGAGVNLERADAQIVANKKRGRFLRQRPVPQYFDYHPPPLRVTQDVESFAIGGYATERMVEVVLYDFGAVSVIFRLSFQGEFSHFLPLSEALYENVLLLENSRLLVESILNTITGSVEKQAISSFVEDYTIYHVEEWGPPLQADDLINEHKQEMAQILRCEREPLSEEEVLDSISSHISFGKHDLTVVDWNAALMFGSHMEDVLAVLEFANVELIERRILDEQLDKTLDHAYDVLSRRTWEHSLWPGSFRSDLRHISQLQVDSAILFERVTNTLKLLGDQYLARVYRLTSKRFHLQGWDTSILRKLETTESIYEKLTDQTGNKRLEVLEWIIIILIAVSILLPFIPGFPGY